MDIKWVEPPPPPPGEPNGSANGHEPDDGVIVEHYSRPVRKPRAFWDRVKLLVLIAVVWGALLWSAMSSDPLLSFHDAIVNQISSKWWLEALFGIELIRQLSYLLEEHSAPYHAVCQGFLNGMEARRLHFSDWTRYRIARIIRWVILIAAVAIIAGAVMHQDPVHALFELPGKAYHALPYVFQILLILLLAVGQFAAIFYFLSKGGVDVYFPDDVKTRFTDVWGQDAVLARVKESMVFLENPASIESKGGYVPGGILLWGPPGTGKTLMAEAIAGETGKPFVFVDPGAFTNMFMGVGILKVKSLFRKLRRLAVRYGGVIVFFDEADSLGNRGLLSPGGIFGPGGGGSNATPDPFGGLSPFAPSCHGTSYLSPNNASMFVNNYLGFGAGAQGAQGAQDLNGPAPEGPRGIRDRMMGMGMMGGGGAGMGTLQALLTEMSGLKKPRGFMNRVVRRVLGFPPKAPPKYRIMIVMATNMPQALDEALLRPGRIDRIYKVGYPSKAGRVRTYQGYLAKVSNSLTESDIDKLATITPYATGATIKDMVNEALILAIGDGREEVTWADILRAKQLKELGPPEDVEYIERERHAVAVHEACHAVVAYRVRHHLEIDLATIEKGSSYLGMVASIQPEDQFTSWRSEYESDVMVSLASLVGERSFFGGDSSSGVSGDLESATYFASMMEGYWGMGSTIASHAITQRIGVGGGGGGGGNGRGQGKGGNNRRELLTGSLGGRIENKLTELLHRTEELLEQNRREVLAVAHALETHKTLNGEDVVAVIEGQKGTIIDGRPYLSQNFLPAAERYHERVVEAHKAHAQIEVPLITTRDWAPELVAAGAAANGQGLAGPDFVIGPNGNSVIWPESPSESWGTPPAD